MSRIISGKMRLDIQPVQPVAFVEAAIETVQPSAEAKGIRLTKRLDPAAGPITGDPEPPAAGGLEPALERHQVHRERRTGRGRARARELPDRDHRGRHGHRHQARVPAARVRALPAGRRLGRLAPPRGSGWGCRSCGTSSSCTAARCRPRVRGKGAGRLSLIHLPLTAVRRGAGPGDRRHPKGPRSAAPEFKRLDLSGITVLVVDDQEDARDLDQARARGLRRARGDGGRGQRGAR